MTKVDWYLEIELCMLKSKLISGQVVANYLKFDSTKLPFLILRQKLGASMIIHYLN